MFLFFNVLNIEDRTAFHKQHEDIAGDIVAAPHSSCLRGQTPV